MIYRDILVQVDESLAAAARGAAAVKLAERLDARLTGVFLKSKFLHNFMALDAISYMSPQDIEALLKEQAAAVDKAGADARNTFSRAAPAGDWLVVDGDRDEAMAAVARRFDLTVFPSSVRVSMGENRISAAGLGLACGGPLLVVPDAGVGAVGDRILVAWKDTRESARALRDAWPLIAAAKAVRFVSVSQQAEHPDTLLAAHLAHHGCDAEIVVDRSQDASAGGVIRRQCEAFQADILVMGLYGHSRLQETILGGVSSDLLQAPPCALFVSH